MMFRTALVAAFFLASAASADVSPGALPYPNNSSCSKYTMCSAQTATGDCTRNSDEIVYRSDGMVEFQFYGTQSTATTYVCNVVTSDAGHDAISGAGVTISGAQLTETAEAIAVSGLLEYVWVTCPTISGGNVTVTMLACPVAVD